MHLLLPPLPPGTFLTQKCSLGICSMVLVTPWGGEGAVPSPVSTQIHYKERVVRPHNRRVQFSSSGSVFKPYCTQGPNQIIRTWFPTLHGDIFF